MIKDLPKLPDDEDIAAELLVTARSIGYNEQAVWKALCTLTPVVGEREACCRIIDAMISRRLIYNENGDLLC